jgi:hypothetical protein
VRISRSASEELPTIEMFAIGPDGEPIGPEPTPEAVAVDVWEQMEPVAEPSHEPRHFRAKAGSRLGTTGGRVARRRSPEDVVQPSSIRPHAAERAILDGSLFTEPLPRLDVDQRSLVINHFGATWKTTLRTGFLRRRHARLRIYPSPSQNLTVLALIPTRRRRSHGERFVRNGVSAIQTLSRRLERVSS